MKAAALYLCVLSLACSAAAVLPDDAPLDCQSACARQCGTESPFTDCVRDCACRPDAEGRTCWGRAGDSGICHSVRP